ncbi:hypothetical protein NLI96_g8947 [Meripilus lineatus]|uniref:Uncharacterized protein n=1 Tax=Meripilus lineatus TaxID=2056292 RepID=A0AAD5YAQ8_9APHY|nr:hypothetical protein NLI96_g8947 [Physisporinus lineatus]
MLTPLIQLAVVVSPRVSSRSSPQEPLVWKIVKFGKKSSTTKTLEWTSDAAIGVPVDGEADWRSIPLNHFGRYERCGEHPAWNDDSIPLDPSQVGRIGARNADHVPHHFVLGCVRGESFERLSDLGTIGPSEDIISEPATMMQIYSVSSDCKAGRPLPKDVRHPLLRDHEGPRPIDLGGTSHKFRFILYSKATGADALEEDTPTPFPLTLARNKST